jgi:hypothetical protein
VSVETRLAAIEVETDPRVFERDLPDWTGYSYVIPEDVENLGPPPPGLCRDRGPWAYRLGGADAQFTRVAVTIAARGSATVRVDDVRIDVLRRRPGIKGTWARCAAGGASGSPRMIMVDLNQDPPTVYYLREGGDAQLPPFDFRIASGDVEVFFIEATTTNCYCEWIARFQLVVGSERREIIVGTKERPLRTSSIQNARPFEWRNGRWRRAPL